MAPREANEIADAAFADARPPKFRGLERAAHIGRIIVEDVRDGEIELWMTLRDVYHANQIAFAPPYPDAKWQALARAQLERLGVEVDD